jgi:hypothetical protein
MIMERISAKEGEITVCGEDGVTWYKVTTVRTTYKDYSWMLENKPTTLPFYVTDENVHDYQKLAIS